MGPAPFAVMLLADMGADVVRIDRSETGASDIPLNPMLRGRRSIALDLKQPADADVALRLAARADLLVEGYRPGTMERLGLGPRECHRLNPRLVYGRMTGWGQQGPLHLKAGHDLNYIALTGALHALGREGAPPTPPLNLLGDYAGGGLYLAFGLLCALRHAEATGEGQIVDAAIVDGVAGLTTTLQWMTQTGVWSAERGTNELDSGAPYYDVYETADGGHVSIAPLEPKFRAELSRVLHLDGLEGDAMSWPVQRERLSEIFRTRTRAQWCEVFADADACFAPVLSPQEAPDHPHNAERQAFLTRDGIRQPAPAPRLSRTPATLPSPPARPGQHAQEILREL
jgi:alpha-methylacyl-CoA racemase